MALKFCERGVKPKFQIQRSRRQEFGRRGKRGRCDEIRSMEIFRRVMKFGPVDGLPGESGGRNGNSAARGRRGIARGQGREFCWVS